MTLILGQLAYTYFHGEGFQIIVSDEIPSVIQEAFVEHIVYRHWDVYDPPKAGYRAAYLYQVSLEDWLFGWVHDNGADDLGRHRVPSFRCYYLKGTVHPVQLDRIFACLQAGPLTFLDHHRFPEDLEALISDDAWGDLSLHQGVTTPTRLREQSHTMLQQKNFIDLLIPLEPQNAPFNEVHLFDENAAWQDQPQSVFKAVDDASVGASESELLALFSSDPELWDAPKKSSVTQKSSRPEESNSHQSAVRKKPELSFSENKRENKSMLVVLGVGIGILATAGTFNVFSVWGAMLQQISAVAQPIISKSSGHQPVPLALPKVPAIAKPASSKSLTENVPATTSPSTSVSSKLERTSEALQSISAASLPPAFPPFTDGGAKSDSSLLPKLPTRPASLRGKTRLSPTSIPSQPQLDKQDTSLRFSSGSEPSLLPATLPDVSARSSDSISPSTSLQPVDETSTQATGSSLQPPSPSPERALIQPNTSVVPSPPLGPEPSPSPALSLRQSPPSVPAKTPAVPLPQLSSESSSASASFQRSAQKVAPSPTQSAVQPITPVVPPPQLWSEPPPTTGSR
jgi:hypothetical protein